MSGLPRLPDRYRLAVALGLFQLLAFLLCAGAYQAFGLSVEWAGGPIFLPLILIATALWFWTRRRTHTDAALAWALLMTWSVAVVMWQYPGLALNRPLADQAYARGDALLGISVRAITAWTAERPGLLVILQGAYLSFLAQVFGLVLILAIRRDREGLWAYLFQYHVCATITLAIAALWPSETVYVHHGFSPLINEDVLIRQLPGFRDGTLTTFRFDDVTGLISMPSFHVAIAWVVTWAVRRSPWLLACFVPLNLLLTASTVMLGEHYAVDVLGGFLVAAVSIAVTPWLTRAIEAQ
jgi:membrane-associated phospholipid phosphatase